ncbi:MAG: FixH family protein [Lysobacter sp.]
MNRPDPIEPSRPSTEHGPKPESPWRMPIVWLVIALPAAVVIASIGLLFIASDGNNDVVRDDVQRTAQIQTADLGPDAIAAEEKLGAIVRIDAELGIIEVLPVSGRFDTAAPLRLTLAHPTLSAEDQTFVLEAYELGWRAPANLDTSHDWKVELGPEDAHWRLRGRLPKGQQATDLRPSLRAP